MKIIKVLLYAASLTASILFIPNIGFAKQSICNEIRLDCITTKPFQPYKFEESFVNSIYDTGKKDFNFAMYGNTQKTILVQDIPFAQYWQLDNPNKYVFHPMVFGRYIFENSNKINTDKISTLLDKTSFILPNNYGKALYYPNYYPLNRMRGPELAYSAISQSEILAGFLHHYIQNPNKKSLQLVESVLKPLFFPHSDGGVDLGVAQLELPLYHSNPEIILNGWLHSLLHLTDYAKVTNDREISNYIHKNLVFFANNYDAWLDNKRNISRYSDTSPQRIIVIPSNDKQNFYVIYKSNSKDLDNYIFEPILDLQNKYSAYDTRINSINKHNGMITMTVTCSSLYQTLIISDENFSIKARDNIYSPYRATPQGADKWHLTAASKINTKNGTKLYQSTFYPNNSYDLICGYPTNFSKKNKANFYHIQHIVALMYLAKHSSYKDDELNSKLEKISLDWLHKTTLFKNKTLKFENPQIVLDSINRGKVLTPATNIKELIINIDKYIINFTNYNK